MELGSEYSLDLSQLNIKEHNLLQYLSDYNYELLDSGRSALRQIPLQEKGWILLPEYICESVIDCFQRDRIIFYEINSDFTINMEDLKDKINRDVAVVFVMHYYGCIQNEDTLTYIRKKADELGIVVIEDTTHSIFSKKRTIGDYVISSIRKWLPIPNGGILYTNKKHMPILQGKLRKSESNSRSYGMILKKLYLEGVLDCNQEYREIFHREEAKLDESTESYFISDYSKFIISCMDIDDIISKRKANYRFLEKGLKDYGIRPACELKEGECPFTFPVRVPDRDNFREYLMDNRIYCAVHWPFDGFAESERITGRINARTLLSLPVDQRYGSDDMKYMIEVISGYRGDLYFKGIS